MSTIRHRGFAIFLACLAPGLAAAEEPYPALSGELDVAGIRIGMPKEEALRAAAERLHVPVDAAQFAPSSAADAASSDRLPVSFSIRTDKETLTVHLTPRLPAYPHSPQVVDRVRYEIPRTPGNEEGMKRAALQRYGSPSNGTHGFSLDWCRKSAPSPVEPGIGCLQAPGPVLRLRGTTIELSDQGFSNAVTQTLSRQQLRFARF